MSPSTSYGWTDGSAVGTLCVVEGLTATEVLSTIHAAPERPLGRMMLSEIDERPTPVGGVPMRQVQLGEQAGTCVLLEPDAGAGGRQGTLLALSRKGRALSISQVVMKAVITVRYALGGVERRLFDAVLWPDEQRGDPLAEEIDLTFGSASGDAARINCAHVAERLFGLQLDDNWVLERAHATYYAPMA